MQRLGGRAVRTADSRCGIRILGVLCVIVVAYAGVSGFGAMNAAAQVTTVEAGPYFPLSGPSLGGGDLAWAERGQRGGYVLVRRALGGGEPRQLRRATTSVPNKFVTVQLAAGPEHTLVQERTIDRVLIRPELAPTPPDPDVLAVSNTGAVETLAGSCRCDRALDFSGSVGLYALEDGRVLRDFASSPAFGPVTFPRAPFLRLAGDYVVSAFRDVSVFDWRRGQELYRLEGVTSEARSIRSVDVQPDGKVAFAYEERGEDRTVGRLGWASPAEPFVHPLPVTGSVFDVRLDSDVVVFRGDRLMGDGEAIGEIGAVGLSGPERVLARPTGQASFDFDGARVAWGERACEGASIVSATLAELTARPRVGAMRGCPLKVAGRPRFSRNRRLAFRISCAGFTYDCTHRRRVVRTARAYRVAGRRIRRGTQINVPSRGVRSERRVRLRLTKTGRLLLARHRRTRLQLAITLGDHESAATTADFAQRRTTHITVP